MGVDSGLRRNDGKEANRLAESLLIAKRERM